MLRFLKPENTCWKKDIKWVEWHSWVKWSITGSRTWKETVDVGRMSLLDHLESTSSIRFLFPERHDLVLQHNVLHLLTWRQDSRLMIETFKLSIYSSTEAARGAPEAGAAAAHSFENPNKPLRRAAILKVDPPPKLLRLESRQAGTGNQADSPSEREEQRGPGASLTSRRSLFYDATVLPPFRRSPNFTYRAGWDHARREKEEREGERKIEKARERRRSFRR